MDEWRWMGDGWVDMDGWVGGWIDMDVWKDGYEWVGGWMAIDG